MRSALRLGSTALLLQVCVSLLLLAPRPAYAETDVSQLMKAAQAAFKARHFQDAANLYKQCHEAIQKRAPTPGSGGGDAEILSKLARCHIRMRDLPAARQWLGEIIESYPDWESQCADAQLLIAQTYADEGADTAAEAAYQKVADSYPGQRGTCACALLAKGRSHFARKDFTGAEVCFRGVVASYGDRKATCGQAKLELARSLLEQWKPKDALAAFVELHTAPGYSSEEKALITLGVALSYQMDADYPNAEQWFGRVITEHGDSPRVEQAYYGRAITRIEVEKYDEAMREDIPNIKVKHLEEFARGAYYLAKRDFATAASHFEQVVPNYPAESGWPREESLGALRRIVFCHLRTGDSSKAEEAKRQLEAWEASH